MNIYEGNYKAWDFLIIILIGIPCGLVRQCDKNAHYSWTALIERYEVSDDKQESLNEVTNRWKICKIKDTSIDPHIWFNELYNINLKFKKIKVKYEKEKDKLKAHVLYVSPEEYKPVRVSCNVNNENTEFKDLKKEIRWFYKTDLNGRKTQKTYES